MSPQTFDLIVALQVALEELDLMKEAAQAGVPSGLVREEGTSQTLEGGYGNRNALEARSTFGRRGLVVNPNARP